MKKLLSILLTVCLMIAVVPFGTFTFTTRADTSGTTGQCTWSLDGTVLTISGNGEMENYSLDKPWGEDITEVIIETGVTRISNFAFSNCKSLESVTILDSVISIGDSAFCYCKKLSNINIPNGVKNISNSFYGCESLTSINIPDSVVSLSDTAFWLCTKLAEINVSPDNAVYCSVDGVVYNKEKTEFIMCPPNISVEVHIPDGVTIIPDGAFSPCIRLKSVLIPDSVTTIGNSAFAHCYKLKNINLPSTVETIGELAFLWCESLKNITIPDSVATIGELAFSECASLESITIPDSVTYMGDFAFYGCDSLESIIIPNNVTSIGNSAFQFCYSLKNITIPDSVATIGEWAFSECASLKSITIPDSVTSIGCGAFYGCSNLNDVWYTGNEIDEQNIIISEYNEELISAIWHYNATGFENYDIAEIFPDTTNDAWYSDAVAYVYSQGMMKGYSDGTFGVSDGIQRQDFLVMLARFDGVDLTQYGYDCNMPDVARGSYYEAAVNWGVEKGITTGYESGKFGVGDKITREQLVTFLYRYAKYKNIDVENVTDTKAKAFPDYNKVTDFAEAPIIWAIDKGVINGKSGYIAPQGNAQRCEIAQIMYNIFQKDIF